MVWNGLKPFLIQILYQLNPIYGLDIDWILIGLEWIGMGWIFIGYSLDIDWNGLKPIPIDYNLLIEFYIWNGLKPIPIQNYCIN